jgi:hypothetical protein
MEQQDKSKIKKRKQGKEATKVKRLFELGWACGLV